MRRTAVLLLRETSRHRADIAPLWVRCVSSLGGSQVQIFDCSDEDTRYEGFGVAASTLTSEHLVILPTDTSYALAGYAFSSASVRRIRSIKHMDRDTPLQVLMSHVAVLDGVATLASVEARLLAERFWPGPLTLIVPSSPTIEWDIGGNPGLVQVRVPDHPVATEVLTRTGPLVVSAARYGDMPIIESVADVADLEHHVAVFLDAGVISPTLSTIVNCTREKVAVLRKGPISIGQLVDVLDYMPEYLGSDDGGGYLSPGEDPDGPIGTN